MNDQSAARAALRRIAAAFCSIALLSASLLFAGCASRDASDGSTGDAEAEVVAALNDFPRAIADKDLDAACDLFAEDAILVFPGGPDRDREAFCDGLTDKFDQPDFTLSYEAPEIQQVVVDGDTAAVRLIWTGTAVSGGETEEWREQGLDVLRRDDDGRWRILISHAFTLEN